MDEQIRIAIFLHVDKNNLNKVIEKFTLDYKEKTNYHVWLCQTTEVPNENKIEQKLLGEAQRDHNNLSVYIYIYIHNI